MTKQQNNKRAMLESVASLIETNAARTSSIPGIIESVARFKNLMDEMTSKTVEVKQSVGKSAAKRQVRAELTVKLLQVAGALHAYACKRNDPELKAKADFTETELRQIRDTEFLSALESILGLVRENAEDLAGQGITPEVMAGFETGVDAYHTALGESLSSIPGRMAARGMIRELFARIDGVLDGEIDRFLEFFRETDPEFYEAYFATRAIRNFGLRHVHPELEVVAPGQPDVKKAA